MQLKPDFIMGKKGYLNDFEHVMAVVPKGLDLSISEKTDLLGYSHLTISRVYKEWYEKEKKSSEQRFCGQKCLVDGRGQRKMSRLVGADTKATLSQITTHYNRGMRKRIPDYTAHQILRQMGYSSRKPYLVPLLSAKNREMRQQFGQAHLKRH